MACLIGHPAGMGSPMSASQVHRSLRHHRVLASALAIASLPLAPSGLRAQTTRADDVLPTLSVTGTALRRIDRETALPVTLITRADIERSGATSLPDLLQRLPIMQGMVVAASVSGNDTHGYSSVSLHDLGDAYTLVLLNGQRLASFAGQHPNGAMGGVDAQTLPLAMIERIEILSDGASSLYGADALGGVVNLITRRDGDVNEATAGWQQARGGARQWSASAFKGLGSLDADGHALALGASAWRRSALPATERSYARDAQRDFTVNGQRVRYLDDFWSMVKTGPANAYDANGAGGNPYLASQGSCPAGQYSYYGAYCLYNYAADLMLVPAQAQQSAMASYTHQVADDNRWMADALWARSTVWSQLAPISTQLSDPLQIPSSSPLYSTYLSGLGITGDPASADVRFVDLGPRRRRDDSSLLDLAARAQGRWQGWAWQAGLKQSGSHQASDVAGYMSQAGAQSLIAQGFNPFVPAGQQSAAGMAALQQQTYAGPWSRGDTHLQGLQWQASTDLMALPAGPLRWAIGADWRQERWGFRPSAFTQGLVTDVASGATGSYSASQLSLTDISPLTPVSASRRIWGAFTEWLAPLQQGPDGQRWELGAALRHDHDDRVGGAFSGKLSTRWQPSPTLMWRASVGTGFRTPTLGQLDAPAQSLGTTGSHDCTAAMQALAAQLGATACDPGNGQFSVNAITRGNAQLKPERSQQASVGLRIEPLAGHSIGLDWWAVRIRDQIGMASEDIAFANPQALPSAWTTVDTAGGKQLVFVGLPQNIQSHISSGIDLEASVRRGSRIGLIDSQLRVSTLLREDTHLYPGSGWISTLGDGLYGAPALRWRAQWRNSLVREGWTHSVTARYQSGYDAAPVTLYVLDDGGNPTGDTLSWRGHVTGTLLWDWQSRWQISSDWQVTMGIDNVFNRRPPTALGTSGVYKAQIIGYDERFFDPRGRVWALQMRRSF